MFTNAIDEARVRGRQLAAGPIRTLRGHNPRAPVAFVVNQGVGPIAQPLVLLGYTSLPEAWRALEPTSLVSATTAMTHAELDYWLRHADTTAPLPDWHRPCLWAGNDDGPQELVLKADNDIKMDPENYLGFDKIGRHHWRHTGITPADVKKWKKLKDKPPPVIKPNTTEILPLSEYDAIIVSFSGGKDSTAMVLDLLERGVPPEKIELWHQLIDGEPGSPAFMDWPCTEAYCKAFADALGVRLRYQWKEGGFLREMFRGVGSDIGAAVGVAGNFNNPTAPTKFQLDGGVIGVGGGAGVTDHRMKFPQKAADLKVRWCSAYLKIQVAEMAIRNDPRFKGNTPAKVLFLTGERREESNNRATYAEAVRHGTSSSTRRVDQWRSIINWPEEKVWDIIKRHNIRPHPGYELGWGRLSCMTCIFGTQDQWASIQAIAPGRVRMIDDLEQRFGSTIDRVTDPTKKDFKGSVLRQAAAGTSWVPPDPDLIKLALGSEYDPTLIHPAQWHLPLGAFRKTGGPP